MDFDHDGYVDLLAAQASPLAIPPKPAKLLAFKSLGNGKFTNVTDVALGLIEMVTPTHNATADFNGDGNVDIIIVDFGADLPPFPGGRSKLLMGKSDGTLLDESALRLPALQACTHHVSVGDVDGDGHPDIYMCNIYGQQMVGPRFYMNDGTGHFKDDTNRIPAYITSLQQKYTASCLVDVNNDGYLDLVLGEHGGSLGNLLLLNDRRGYFTNVVAMPPKVGGLGWQVIDITSADFDGDGWFDLLLAEVDDSYANSRVQLLLNNRNGTFRDLSINLAQDWCVSGNYVYLLSTPDLNGDGLPDILLGGWGQSFRTRIFLNRGNAHFLDVTPLLDAPAGYCPVAVQRFTGGGVDDILVDQAPNFTLFKNTGDWAAICSQLVPQPPRIVCQPASQVLSLGSGPLLTVLAEGTSPLHFRWQRDGSNISDVSGFLLRPSLGDSVGDYSVVVSNAAGSATSKIASVSFLSYSKLTGLVVEGPVGNAYTFAYRNMLGGTSGWVELTNLVLRQRVQTVMDPSMATHFSRFFRAVPSP